MSMVCTGSVPGQVIVRLKADGPRIADDSFVNKYHAEVVDNFNFRGNSLEQGDETLQLQLPAGTDLAATLRQMKQDPNVAFAQPNYTYKLQDEPPSNPPSQPGQPQEPPAPGPNQLIPNDLTEELWGMHNTGQNGGKEGADINAPEAWAVHTGRHDAPIIALIDTGVDYNHPDLAANMWTNAGEIAGDGIDNDGNGVIDDVHGYNAFADSGDPLDGHGHGTHCAGTIAGVGNNGLGVVGVNHNANLMAIKIFDDSGSTTEDAILRGIQYATKMGARITSNSWGGNQASDAQKAAFIESPALHIMAAGNNGWNNDFLPNYPSNYDMPNNIAVAASDRNDNRASFSCYGRKNVDIAAPGVDIYSCAPGGGYQMMSGTSMATPHVAGVAALVASAYPEATNDELKARILNGADKLDNWKSKVLDGNRLNAYGALTAQP